MQTNTLETLLMRNQRFAQDFDVNPLMVLIKSYEIEGSECRKKLLDAIQVFSNYFQKVVVLRHLLTEAPEFSQVANLHLKEELGHNELLAQDRAHRPPVWDTVLEATSSWFAWKMLTSNDEERTVLVHLVLETSANLFFHEAHRVMQTYGETDYFKSHAELDEKHEKMGQELLQGLSEKHYVRLLQTQEQGWDMLNTCCKRIAEIATSNANKNFNK